MFDKIKSDVEVKLRELQQMFLTEDTKKLQNAFKNFRKGNNKQFQILSFIETDDDMYLNVQYMEGSEVESNEFKMFANSGSNSTLNQMKESRSINMARNQTNQENLLNQEKFDEMFLTAAEKYKEKLIPDAYSQIGQEVNLIVGM